MKIKNRHILDTAKVCQKAQQLNQSAAEDRALAKRCVYELRWAIFVEKWEALSIFLGILDTIKFKKTAYYIGKISLAIKPPLHRYAHWMISKWMQI